MVVMQYQGHTLRLATGGLTIHHQARLAGENTPGLVSLEISTEGGMEGVLARLTVDEAQKLATTLLRDVSLLRFGSG